LFTIYVTYPKLISHSTIISALDTIQLGFSQTLNTEQFSTGLSLSSAIEENLTYDLQFLNNDQDVYIYPENSFISGDTISLILSADQITNAYGYGLDGNQNDVFEGSPLDNDTVTVYVNYSGDFDGNDQVDFDDLALFANGWYSKDYKYELGPVTGDIPHFITMTDSLFNIEDAMTFGRMWNWFVGIGKHVITMPQLSLGGGFTTEQNGNDLIIHSRASAGKRIVLQYDPEIITINREQRSLTKPTDLTFEFYADCIDSNRSEYVHYSFNEEISNVPVIFTIKSKQRNPVNITIGVEGINENGELILSDVITTQFQPIPDKFEVFPNYPNPFNSQTVIEYAIPVQSDVLINIYDLLGRKVKTLTNNRHEAKYFALVWDAKDDHGRLAASGLYFLRIVARTESKTFIKTKKMVMIR
ncbi:MAG: T9SS type A sorting domain-containing protein, partial [Candidatus Marinimicrobia bacterium]|nr:T9SS type A sorting domain-containing protein [Candidatus Neomarinimicrobiota bacterium]